MRAERTPRGLVSRARSVLAEPRLAGVDVDSPALVDAHRRILLEKPVMRAVFAEFYAAVLAADARWFTAPGVRVELGAGSSVFGELHPGVIGTDIKITRTVRAVVDAQNLPFRAGAVRAFYGINCFHHFPDPARFFHELERVLDPGGGCVLIEPYHGPFAAALYARLFASERFDPAQAAWHSAPGGPMRGANQALSYLVFTRDAAEFRERFPSLDVVAQRPLSNYPRYLLAGGLNFRSLVPPAAGGVLRGAEWLLRPLARWLALHQLIVLRRRAR